MTDWHNDPAGYEEAPPRRFRGGWYFTIAVLLLVIAAFFRLWHLGTAPPGLSHEELINVQLSEQMRQGHISVIYEEVRPAREGLYFAMLAFFSTMAGKGLILWRLPSVWIAMLSLAMTATLLRRLFGVRVALIALSLMAISFWPVWMGRVVQHVTLMPLITTFVLYTLTRAYLAEERTSSSLWFTVGGLMLGAAQYIHVTAWTLIVLLIAFVVYRTIVNRDEMRRHWGNILYALSLTGVLMIPLLIFLVRHPGAREPVPITQQPTLLAEIPGRILSSLGALALRGDMLPEHNIPGRPVLGPLIAVLLIVGVGIALIRTKQPSYGLAILWMTIGILPTAFLPRKPDFEFMAVILPVVFVFPAIGMVELFNGLRDALNQRPRLAAIIGMSVGLVVLVAFNAVRTYQDYFVTWPQLGDVRLNYQADLGVLAHYLDTSTDPTPISICTTPLDESDPFALTNAQLLSYLMHRRQMNIRYFDCTQSLVLAEGGASQRIIFPRGHYYDHLPGPLLAWMRYAHDEQVAGIRPDVIMRLEITDEIADVAGAFITTAPTAWPPEEGSELAALPIQFAGNVTFLGYTVRDDTLRPTDWVEMTTFWRLDGPPPAEMMMFTHLLGNSQVVIAQDDGLGVEIGTLQTADIFLQYSMIQTPGRMAEGLYPLSVGLYIPSTQQRLNAYDGDLPRASRLFLQRIEMRP